MVIARGWEEILRANSASGRSTDSCRVFERESIICKKQNYAQEGDHVVYEPIHTSIWNAGCLSQCVKNILKACNLTGFCLYLKGSHAHPFYITLYIIYITSLLLFPLVIFFPHPQQSEHDSGVWSVHEAGIVVSPPLTFSALWSSWLISLGCFKGMQEQCFSHWKGTYAIVPGSTGAADGRISGPKDPLPVLCFCKEQKSCT